jgi:hypothetical protein
MNAGMDHGGAHELIHWIAALVLVIGGAIFLALAAHLRVGPARRPAEARAARGDGPADVAADAVDLSLIRIVASLSFGAAAIHLVAAPPHYTELGDLGAGFLVAGVLQAAWARAALRATTRRTAWIGIVANLGIVAAWAVSRTVGLPIGPEPWTPEAIGLPDGASTIFELLIVAGLAIRLLGIDRTAVARRPSVRSLAAIAVIPTLGLVLLTTSLSAVAIAAGADQGRPHSSSVAADEHTVPGQ